MATTRSRRFGSSFVYKDCQEGTSITSSGFPDDAAVEYYTVVVATAAFMEEVLDTSAANVALHYMADSLAGFIVPAQTYVSSM